MKSLLLDRYQNEIAATLQKEFALKNPMEVTRIEKICINVGMGSHLQRIGKKDGASVEAAIEAISGKKPVVRISRMSVSNFKLREGMPVGVSVTLRDAEAHNFLDKLINVVYPRVQGFRGEKNGIFDKNGNCSVGFKEHTVFPEISVDDSRMIHGVQVTIVMSSSDEKQNKKLLELMGFPFKK